MEHLSSPLIFSVVCVAQCVVLCRSLFVFSGMCVTKQTMIYRTLNIEQHKPVLCRSLFVFSVVCVSQCLVFCVMLCRSLFVFSGVCVAQCLVFSSVDHCLFSVRSVLLNA
jgi:hypothetical protein